MILLISTKTIGMAIKGSTIVFDFFFFAYTNLFLKTINIVQRLEVVLIFPFKKHSKLT
jgi:hypothetical protein